MPLLTLDFWLKISHFFWFLLCTICPLSWDFCTWHFIWLEFSTLVFDPFAKLISNHPRDICLVMMSSRQSWDSQWHMGLGAFYNLPLLYLPFITLIKLYYNCFLIYFPIKDISPVMTDYPVHYCVCRTLSLECSRCSINV